MFRQSLFCSSCPWNISCNSCSSNKQYLQDMHIYDKWVIRDADGELVDSKPSYDLMHSAFTRERLLAGLPFPATSCWNGLVVMTAKPFLDGLRFRSAGQFPPPQARLHSCEISCIALMQQSKIERIEKAYHVVKMILRPHLCTLNRRY